tara:strand:- start:127 stop:432 length:306 start_codon:yes stop_codon:yes gene_type:complete
MQCFRRSYAMAYEASLKHSIMAARFAQRLLRFAKTAGRIELSKGHRALLEGKKTGEEVEMVPLFVLNHRWVFPCFFPADEGDEAGRSVHQRGCRATQAPRN